MKFTKLFGVVTMMFAFALVGCNDAKESSSDVSKKEPVSSEPIIISEAPSSVASSKSIDSSVASSSSDPIVSSSAPVEEITISLPWTNAIADGFCDNAGKTVKGGYTTWNLTGVVAGTYEFHAFAKQGSGADQKTLATRCYKFVINNGAEIDPTNNDKIPTDMGVTSSSSFTEGVFSNLTLPAGDVALKFGTTAESDYRLTFDLTQPAKLVKVA